MPAKKKSVYLETTIPSFATAKTSRDAIIAGHQTATILFWETERQKYELYISQYVIEECKLGDAEAANRRLNFLKDIAVLQKTSEVESLGVNAYSKIKDYNKDVNLHTPMLLTPEALMEMEGSL